MQNKAEDRPTSQELWADPWLQNFGPTNDQSLISQSSRQSYSTRGGSNYNTNNTNTNPNTSARYIKTNSQPHSNNQRSGRNKGTEEKDKQGAAAQTINNNINIINNITQITYHTATEENNKNKNNKNVSKGNLNQSNANLEISDIDKQTM